MVKCEHGYVELCADCFSNDRTYPPVRSFQRWWEEEGSRPPRPGQDVEEHTRTIAEIAWENGAYCATVEMGRFMNEDERIYDLLLARLNVVTKERDGWEELARRYSRGATPNIVSEQTEEQSA